MLCRSPRLLPYLGTLGHGWVECELLKSRGATTSREEAGAFAKREETPELQAGRREPRCWGDSDRTGATFPNLWGYQVKG